MNIQKKRDEIRGTIARIFDGDSPVRDELVDAIMQALNSLVVIPDYEAELPSPRNAVNKSYNDYMLGQEDMLGAGYVKVHKLMEE